MPYFTTQDGCRLFYETQGVEPSKRVVVFLNGTLQNTLHWKTHAKALKDQFWVVMYDARAQGQSDLGSQELSLDGHVGDLSALLQHLGVEKAHLVGLSHGAKVALTYAAQSPQHVDRLVLCSVGATATCRSKLLVKSWLEILKDSGLEAMAWFALPIVFGERFLKQRQRILDSIVKGIVMRNSKEALIAHFEAMVTYPPLSQIARHVHVPSLVISGSDDPLVTEEGAKELAELCGGRQKHIVGVGHTVPAEAPELFNETTLEFLCET
jgi:pimeloyl-ACP methyl ester carboxylesterase